MLSDEQQAVTCRREAGGRVIDRGNVIVRNDLKQATLYRQVRFRNCTCKYKCLALAGKFAAKWEIAIL